MEGVLPKDSLANFFFDLPSLAALAAFVHITYLLQLYTNILDKPSSCFFKIYSLVLSSLYSKPISTFITFIFLYKNKAVFANVFCKIPHMSHY